MKSPQFSLEEQQLIVEALLFSVGVDVCAEWTPKQNQIMLEVAKRINNKDYKLESVYLYEGDQGLTFEEPEIAKKIIRDFPNLPRHQAIFE